MYNFIINTYYTIIQGFKNKSLNRLFSGIAVMTFHNQRDYCVVKPFFTMIQKLLSCLDFPISACLDFPKYMELEFDSLPYQPAYRNLSFIRVDLEGMPRASEFESTLEVSFIFFFYINRHCSTEVPKRNSTRPRISTGPGQYCAPPECL